MDQQQQKSERNEKYKPSFKFNEVKTLFLKLLKDEELLQDK